MKTNTQDGKNPQVEPAFRFGLSIDEKEAPAELMALVSEFLKLEKDPANSVTVYRYKPPMPPKTYSISFDARLPYVNIKLGRCSLNGGYKGDEAKQEPTARVQELAEELVPLMERLEAEGLAPHGQAPEAQETAEVTPPREEQEAVQDAPAPTEAEKTDRSEEKNMPPASALAPSPTPTPPTPSVPSSSSDTASFPADWVEVKETSFIAAYIKALDTQSALKEKHCEWREVMRQSRLIFAKAGVPTFLCSAAPKNDTYEVLPFSVALEGNDRKTRVPATVDPGAIDGQAEQMPHYSAWAYPPKESQIWCLDLDRHDKEDGEKALTQYLAETVGEGAFAALMGKAWVDRTKRNGLHIFIAAPKEGSYSQKPKDGVELKQTNGVPLAGSSYFEGAARKELYSNVNRGGVLTGGRIYAAILDFFKQAEVKKKICDAPALPTVLPSSNTPSYGELMKRVQANANKKLGEADCLAHSCSPSCHHFPLLEAAVLIRKFWNFIPSSPYRYFSEKWLCECRPVNETTGKRNDADSKAIWKSVVKDGRDPNGGVIEMYTVESQLAYVLHNDRPMPSSRKQQNWEETVPEEPNWIKAEFEAAEAVPFEQGSWENATCYNATPSAPAPSTPSAPQSDRNAEAEKGPAAVELEALKALADRFYAGTYFDHAAPPREYLLDGSLPKVGVALLSSPPGCGKGFFSLQLCASLACGRDFLHWKVGKAIKTLYLSAEDDLEAIHERMERLKTAFPEESLEQIRRNMLAMPSVVGDIEDPSRTIAEFMPLFTATGDHDHLPELDALIDATGAKLVVLDTLQHVALGLEENDVSKWGALMGKLNKFARRKGIMLLLTHHIRKGEGADSVGNKTDLMQALSQFAVRGSSAIVAVTRWACNMCGLTTSYAKKNIEGVEEDAPDGKYLAIRVAKKNGGPLELTYFAERQEGGFLRPMKALEKEEDAKAGDKKRDLEGDLIRELEARRGGEPLEANRTAIMEALGCTQRAASDLLARAESSPRIEIVRAKSSGGAGKPRKVFKLKSEYGLMEFGYADEPPF